MNYDQRIAAAREAERSGALDDALTCYEDAFAHLMSGCAGDGTAGACASLYRWIGTVHRQRGDLERAQEAYDASLAIAERAGLPLQMASVLNCMGIVAQYRGDCAGAEHAYAQARTLSDATGGERIRAMIDLNQATLSSTRGEHARAIESYRDAIDRFRRLGDDHSEISAINNLGMAHRDRGEWGEAERCFDEAFGLAHRLRDTTLLGTVELNRAELWLAKGCHDEARESCDRAFEIYTRVQSLPGLGEAYKVYGALFTRTGKPNLADAHFDRALEHARSCEDRLLEAEVLAHRAQLCLETQRNSGALACLNASYRIFGELGAGAALLDLEHRLDGLEETYLMVVAAWARSIDDKDAYTAGHCGRVADYACTLAEACGITGRELTWFRMGAFLHDVGKTEVPLEILNKPGKLSEEEWRVIQNHTVAGAAIVEPLNFPWPILPMVRSHHERWDGTGYPDRLAGEAIPRNARILCVADVYDALTTARAYRPALSHEEALRIMASDVGRGLDPELFTRFRDLITGAGSGSGSRRAARPALVAA